MKFNLQTNNKSILSVGGSMETQSIHRKKQLNQETILQMARILIVEDDITSRPIWEYIIGKADRSAKFDWAKSVDEAEFKIEESVRLGQEYDLIVSDIFLSGSKTGIDLWKKYDQDLNKKIVLVSGIEQMKLMKYLGADKAPIYLKKPLNVEDCIEVVYEVLHQKPF
jgi:response regulator of citrate/malate metabolism